MPEPQSLPEICPFLASANDPDSVFNYPSGENRCSKLGGQLPVSSEYQLAYCLRTRHWFCPVFTGTAKKPPVPIRFEGSLSDLPKNNAAATLPSVPRLDKLIPARLTEARSEPTRRIPRQGLAILLIVIVLGVAGAAWAARRGAADGTNGLVNPVSGTGTDSAVLPLSIPSGSPTFTVTLALSDTATWTVSPTTAPTLTASPTIVPTNTLTLTAINTMTATATDAVVNTASPTASIAASATGTAKPCTPPTNWQTYTVAAGETYYKIATRFNTTVEALQRVNCLSNPGKLLAGQTIYVPPSPATPE